ncbi:MAG: phage tail protein [Clostridiaceae bacterium]
MYRILFDSYVLYDPRLPELFVFEPELTQKKNEPGELTFKIPKEHPHYGVLEKLKSRIKVYRDDILIWVGRAIEDERDLYENRKVVAEGVLAFLLDSILRPFTMDGTATETWEYLLTQHNAQVNESQRLTLGNCDLSGSVGVSTKDYLSSWQTLKTCLLDSFGGYLIVRYDEDENPILDYLSDVPDTSTQRIEFGENMIDLALSRSASETYTACVPLGAALRYIDPESDSDARLTIASVNDGQDFLIDSALAADYGVIFAPSSLTTWDEITDANVLANRGRDWLSGTGARFKQTIKLSAVDLHNADANVESFQFLDKVVVSCGTLCPEETYVLSELTIPLNNPASTGIVLGNSRPSLIGEEIRQNRSIKNRIETIEADYTTHGEIKEIVQEQLTQNTSILQSAQQIIMTALEDYVRTQDFVALQNMIQTSFSIMAGTIEANFTETASRISTLNGESSQQFESVRSFIRMISSGIVIGKSTSAIKLKLENDVLYFFSGSEDSVTTDSAIAYFSSGKLYVNDVQVLSSLRIGGYAWVPENGNLNFKKIGE